MIKRVLVLTYSTRYSCLILKELNFYRQIFEQYSNMKFPVTAELFGADKRADG